MDFVLSAPMLELRSDRAAFPALHCMVARQLAVSLIYAALIVYARRTPDSPIGVVLERWMNESSPWVRAILFFEPAPSSEIPEGIAGSVLAYRHILVGSLGLAIFSIVASRQYWPTWAAALSAKAGRAKLTKSEFARIRETGFYQMILGAIAATFLAIYAEPSLGPPTLWSPSPDWAILRAPILIGVATAFVLLAATLRRYPDRELGP